MNRIRVKICGITNEDDAVAAGRAGVDAVGLVFWSRSPRAVDVESACRIVSVLPPLTSAIGLFLDPTAEEVATVLAQVRLHALQFHGLETAQDCQKMSAGRPFIKAISAATLKLGSAAAAYPEASALLVDAHAAGEAGGTGHSFDWSLLAAAGNAPWILAGGLTANNVAEAVARSGVTAVDVSSGVESAPGKKDAAAMQAFVQAAQRGVRR